MLLTEHQPMAIIQSMRCFNCRRFAYTDLFKGDFGLSGYLCRLCARWMEGEFA